MMTYQIVHTFPHPFFTGKKGPHISIYQETSRHASKQKHDALVFKNLVKDIELTLSNRYSPKDIKPLMTMLKTLENESTFWRQSSDGIALFATLETSIIYHLKRPVPTTVEVSDSFHLKPLIAYFQIMKDYHILSLDAESFDVYQSNPYEVDRVLLGDGVPRTLKDILGDEHTPSYHTHGTYGGASDSSTFHGHGGKKADEDIDLKRFFRQVDALVYEHVSKDAKRPLLLLTRPEYEHLYRSVSDHPYLEDHSLFKTFEDGDDTSMIKSIRAHAEKAFMEKIDTIKKQYHQQQTHDTDLEQPLEILSAAKDGRIETLLIGEDATVPIFLDQKKNLPEMTSKNLRVPDLLDDLAQLTIEKKGQVYILNSRDMPNDKEVVAIYRY
jgi:hypothetical protein